MQDDTPQAATPDLSVIVAIVSDTTDPKVDPGLLDACLDRLLNGQTDSPRLEIIVPWLNHITGIDALGAKYPSVRFLPVAEPDMSDYEGGKREHHDLIRARGLAAATGRLVALLEDHSLPDENWTRAIVAAHASDHAGIGGAVENAVDAALNWAVYFCDFYRYQNPVPEGPTDYASDANTSYKRADLDRIPEVWRESFREVVVNGALREAGRSIVLDRSIVTHQNRAYLSFGEAMTERFVWGRSFAATRNRALGLGKRIVYAALSPALPFVLFLRMMNVTRARGRNTAAFFRASPITMLLLLTWSAGEAWGYLFGLSRKERD